MAYREDEDLKFLKGCSNEQLSPLVEVLTKRKSGGSRFTEELTMNDRYKAHFPNHQEYWDLIAAEIQCFGANTAATMVRGGKGVRYREVLKDVCEELDIGFSSGSSVFDIEAALLLNQYPDSKHKNQIFDAGALAVGGQAKHFAPLAATKMSPAASVGAVPGGPLGPLIAVVALALVTGPAFRVTKPATQRVALLRRGMMAEGWKICEFSFSERFWEAVDLLVALGARRLSVESEMELSSMAAGKLDAGWSAHTMESEGETSEDIRKKYKYEVKYPGPCGGRSQSDSTHSFESMLEKSVWYREDPFFERLLNDYRRGVLEGSERKFEYECSLKSLAHGKFVFSVIELFRVLGRVEVEKKNVVKFSIFARF